MTIVAKSIIALLIIMVITLGYININSHKVAESTKLTAQIIEKQDIERENQKKAIIKYREIKNKEPTTPSTYDPSAKYKNADLGIYK